MSLWVTSPIIPLQVFVLLNDLLHIHVYDDIFVVCIYFLGESGRPEGIGCRRATGSRGSHRRPQKLQPSG